MQEGREKGSFDATCFNIQLFYREVPVHFIPQLLICPLQQALSRFWSALAACLSGLSPFLFDCCWTPMTLQHIIYLANDADHLVIQLTLMWISTDPNITAFRQRLRAVIMTQKYVLCMQSSPSHVWSTRVWSGFGVIQCISWNWVESTFASGTIVNTSRRGFWKNIAGISQTWQHNCTKIQKASSSRCLFNLSFRDLWRATEQSQKILFMHT